ncbi:MAG: hypothetical protein U9N86_16905 [Bacteroidota bacterium]|nr:hypothetical protein [Bacteroidota bacterium]
MMRKNIVFFLSILLIILALAPDLAYSQSKIKPMLSGEVFDHFDQLYKVDARLVSGDFYQTPFMNNLAGHPFFFDPAWKSGSVVLDGIQFDNLQIRYDINSNQLILNTVGITGSYIQLILKKNQISSFNIGNHAFRPYPGTMPLTGVQFCEILASGKVDFLLVKTKRLKVAADGSSDYVYQSSQMKTLQMNDELIRYRGRRTLYKLFPELKAQLRNFIKNEHLKYRRISLEGHVKLISFCNSLLLEEE